MPQIEQDAEIGFNVGGFQASQEFLDAGFGEATYGFYSWQVCDPANIVGEEFFCGAGGTIISDAHSFATLLMVQEVGTAVEEEALEGVPDQFVLAQNYPNPFNPATTIEYGLHQAGRVTLDVYNALGQHIVTLVDGHRPAGTYRVQWVADDLPSGAYLYQLRVDGALVAAKSMMLVK